MASKKTQIRPSKIQIRMLLEYMREHPNFASGKFTTALGQAQIEKDWASLKDLLNEQGHARSIEQWKVTWRDQKSKARKEGGAHHRALNETGNTAVPDLSENATMILDTIGTEMAIGIGRAESSVGFSSLVQAPADTHEHDYVQRAGPSGSEMLSSSPAQTPAGVPKSNFVQKPKSSKTLPKNRRKAQLPPERFLSAQLEQNKISQNQLQTLNDTLACINATLQGIQGELIESNKLRRMQIQGHGIDQEIIMDIPPHEEVFEVEYEGN